MIHFPLLDTRNGQSTGYILEDEKVGDILRLSEINYYVEFRNLRWIALVPTYAVLTIVNIVEDIAALMKS